MSTRDTTICCLSSCAAGIGAAVFGCILSWADHQKRRNGGVHTPQSKGIAIFGAIGSTVFGFSSLVGLYFGPVTLVVVLRAGSLLPANAFFSQLFRFRPLTRDDYLGTMVTIAGVLCFSIFGGTPAHSPSGEEFLAMITTTAAIVCNIVLAVVCVGSLVVLTFGGEDQLWVALAVTNLGGVSSAFMDLSAKGWSAALDRGFGNAVQTPLFWSSLAFNVLFLVMMRAGMIYGCKRCDVLLFVPLNTVLNIFYSVLAGMVVLQEWKQVISWPGLLGASTSVLGGVVMLVTGPATQRDDRGESHESWASRTDDSSEDTISLTEMEDCVRSSTSPPRQRLDFEGVSPLRPGDDGSPPPPPGSPLLTGRTPPRPCTLSASYDYPQATSSKKRDKPRRSHSLGDVGTSHEGREGREGVPPLLTQFIRSVHHGLRPEMIMLNSRHLEAFHMRRRWNKLKSRLKHMVPIDHYRSRSGSVVGSPHRDSTVASHDEESEAEWDDESSEEEVCSGRTVLCV
mmetsp:Transcript_158358/g.507908  ORF Transcript_158358/g.507908 Transcript_158358/m.507908 type:complete len:510 (+) Transcript_158358:187-1716(+)